MKTSHLLNGLLLAVMLTALAIPLGLLLTIAFEPRIAFNFLIGILGGLAIAIQLYQSDRIVGRNLIGLASFLILGVAAFQLSGAKFCLLAALLIWVSRSLLSYKSLLSTAADLGLSTLSIASAFWAYQRYDSLLWGIWVFFLVQALACKIPRAVSGRTISAARRPQSRFDQAYSSAESALRQIIQGA